MEKRGSPPIPKEHGAWALLYGPFVVVLAAMAGFHWRMLLLFLAMTGVFLAHEPLSKVVRISRHGVREEMKRHWTQWLVIYLSVSLICSSILIFGHQFWLLIPMGVATAALLSIHLYLTSRRRERTLSGEVIGVVALTASAPITAYVIEGSASATALRFWVLNLLYFTSGLFFVKMQVHRFIKRQEYRGRLWQCAAYHVGLVGALAGMIFWDYIPLLVALVYLPIVVRAFWAMLLPPAALNLRKIGFTELGFTAVFVLSLAVVWHLS